MSTQKLVNVTNGQFRLFEREVRKWQSALGLRSWEIYVEFKPLEGQARCWWETEQHVANIALSTEQPGKFSNDYIRRFALHECLELLMSGCTDIMRQVSSEERLGIETHTVIRALENVILGDPK